MNTKTSDRHDLYLHLRARAYRVECAILTEDCCARDDTVYGNGQKYKPLTDAGDKALERDLARVQSEIKQIEENMSPTQWAVAEAEAIEERIAASWDEALRPGQTLEN